MRCLTSSIGKEVKMYKKIILVLSFAMIFIFGFGQKAFANEKIFEGTLPETTKKYYFLYHGPTGDRLVTSDSPIHLVTHQIEGSYYFSNNSSNINVSGIDFLFFESGKWVQKNISLVLPKSNADSIKNGNNYSSNYDIKLDGSVFFSRTVVISGVELTNPIGALLEGLLTNLEILLPICLVILSLVLSTSLIKRVIFSFL